ncbi:hypothetical protein H2203_004661 [Taxawa tesnikishii (nom. ined.)]|nr:hypothetical protein H2203_004661 [Dothideales sp. JES 119]
MASILYKRQCSMYGGDYCDDSWWWSDTGMTVRYVVVAIVFLVLVAFLVGSYYHAKKRIRQGLPPLAYHRWLVARRRHPQQFQQQHGYATYYQQESNGQAYPMHGYPPAPPAYNAWDAPPPVYQPPEGATKVAGDQNFPNTHHNNGESSSSANVAAPPSSHQATRPYGGHVTQ